MKKLAVCAVLGALLTAGSARADEKADALLKEVKAAPPLDLADRD